MADRSSGFRVKLMLAVALAPCIWSVVAHAWEPAPRSFSDTSPRPWLVFGQYLVDKGQVDPTSLEDAKFRFVNSGTGPVTINKLTASCGCLQPVVLLGEEFYRPDEEDRMSLTIPPGAAGMILLRVQLANQLDGAKEYSITLETRDKIAHWTQLAFHLQLPDRGVIVRPRSLAFSQRTGVATEQEIVVTDMRDGGTLSIEGVSCNSKLVQLEVADAQTDENGFRLFPIKMTVAGDVPPGSHVTMVRIFTNDTQYPELRVPLRIEGPHQVSAGDRAQPR